MDDTRALADILETATAFPAAALVALFERLRSDAHLLERAVDRCLDQPSFEPAVAAIQQAVDVGGAAPESIGAGGWLHALAALDRLLAERARGDTGAHCVRAGEAGAWLVPRPRGWTADLAERQASHVVHWLRHHWIVPARVGGWSVDIVRDDPVWNTLARFSPADLRVWAGAFDDSVGPRWGPGPRYRCADLNHADVRSGTIAAALTHATRERAHIVVFPELTVTPAQRMEIADRLCESGALLLVVPGSFHRRRSLRAPVHRGGPPPLRSRLPLHRGCLP